MEIVVSIDDVEDALDNIDKNKQTSDEKSQGRMLYEQTKVS